MPPLYIPLPESLAGKTLAEAAIGARTGLNVIAIQEDKRLVTNPRPGEPLVAGAALVALCSAEQRRRLTELLA